LNKSLNVRINEERQVSLATRSFQASTMYRWTSLV